MTGRGWTLADLPDLHGRRALVTGVTSGLGEVTARELARAGAEVLLVARNPDKLDATVAALTVEVPDAAVVPVVVDLADLDSVRRGAAKASACGPLDVLVNNAGVMATPALRTVDGLDLQMGTNHFGHFALTGLLLPQLVASGSARVVTVSSLMARTVRKVRLDDPHKEHRPHRKWNVYGQSKLANLLFAVELDRRVRAAGLPVTSVAAHPGYTHTNLVAAGMNLGRRRLDGAIGLAVTSVIGQSAEAGALPQLMAATLPDLPGASYAGPSGPFELSGPAQRVRLPRAAQDPRLAAALWSLSEKTTGVPFP